MIGSSAKNVKEMTKATFHSIKICDVG